MAANKQPLWRRREIGRMGGTMRARTTSAERLSEIGRAGGLATWAKFTPDPRNADRLRTIIETHDLSVATVASVINVTKNAVYCWLRDPAAPSFHRMPDEALSRLQRQFPLWGKRQKFKTRAQIEQYLSHEKIKCLECGQRYAFLPSHLKKTHGMDANEYREYWGLPRGTPLAGLAYRHAHEAKIQRMIARGELTFEHLPAASQKARQAGRPKRAPVDAIAMRELLHRTQPYNRRRIPPGGVRADGRDADRRREYQRAYRALKSGDESLMAAYRKKWLAK